MMHLLFAALLTPSEVLAKAKAAVGVREPGTYRIETREIHNGATNSYVRIVQGENYSLTEHDDGDITSAEGRLNGVDWTQSINGVVLKNNGAGIVKDPYDAALGTPDASLTTAQVQSDADGNIVLVVTPRRGLTERSTYDAKTFLPLRVEYDDPDGRRSFVYSDYRRCYGVMTANHVQFTTQYKDNNSVLDLVSCERVPANSVSLAIPASKAVFDLGSRASLLIPSEFSPEGGIIVRLTIGGRGMDFLLDSGASASVIDDDVARQLGLQVHDQGTMTYLGTTTVGYTTLDDVALGDMHASHFAIQVIHFAGNPDGDNRVKVVGLLGGDFFASGRIAVDFGKKTVTMLAPGAPLSTDGWSKLPIEVTDFVPMTTAKFNGVAGTFLVDLGASSTILDPHYFAQFTPNKIGGVQGQLAGITNEGHDFRTYTFSRIDLGDLAFADIHVDVMDGGNAVEEIYSDGLLGRTFWDNFAMIFDYAGQTLYLKPEI